MMNSESQAALPKKYKQAHPNSSTYVLIRDYFGGNKWGRKLLDEP